jgi:hypothetical protein
MSNVNNWLAAAAQVLVWLTASCTVCPRHAATLSECECTDRHSCETRPQLNIFHRTIQNRIETCLILILIRISRRSNIVATKSLSSPFGYNDCDDAAQYPGQPSSSSHTHDGQGQGPNPAGSAQQPLNSNNNYGAQYNQFNQYPLPMPPLPPNISVPHPNTVIGRLSPWYWYFIFIFIFILSFILSHPRT